MKATAYGILSPLPSVQSSCYTTCSHTLICRAQSLANEDAAQRSFEARRRQSVVQYRKWLGTAQLTFMLWPMETGKYRTVDVLYSMYTVAPGTEAQNPTKALLSSNATTVEYYWICPHLLLVIVLYVHAVRRKLAGPLGRSTPPCPASQPWIGE